MPGRSGGEHRFRGDDGSADPRAAAALAAFASGRGSEHAALMSLADSRLLVPVVAALAEEVAALAEETAERQGGTAERQGGTAERQGGTAERQGGTAPPGGPGHCGTGDARRPSGGAEKTSDMALPTLVGQDGRRAVPAFTSLDALIRWRPAARPVPTQARLVWRAAIADSCAVVIDIAGPVPLAIEGARLVALARGEAVPLPHEDPDVFDAVAAVVAEQPGEASISLAPGEAGGDLVIQLALPAGPHGARADELARLVGAGVLASLGARLRRGIAIAVRPIEVRPIAVRPIEVRPIEVRPIEVRPKAIGRQLDGR